jgi:hypothetical protein
MDQESNKIARMAITYPRQIGCDFGSFTVLATLEELLILLHVEVLRAGQICSAGQLECELRIVEDREDIRDNGLLVDVDAEDLPFLVDANNSIGHFVLSGDKNGFARYTVHVDVGTRLKVVEMYKVILRDEVDDPVLLGHLLSNREIIGGKQTSTALLAKGGSATV